MQPVARYSSRAFTLLELLVVIAIIATLASFVIVVTGQFFKADVARTRTIIATVAKAMELAKAATGSAPSPEEHPLAGSRAPRFKFITKEGTPLSSAGRALKGRPRYFYVQGQRIPLVTSRGEQRLQDPEDIYADSRVPMLFGVRRLYLGILGAKQAAVTHYVRLTQLDLNQLRNGTADMARQVTPIDDSADEITNNLKTYEVPNSDDMSDMMPGIRQDGTLLLPLGNKVVIDQVLNTSGMQGELASLKALASAYMVNPPGGYPATKQEQQIAQDLKNITLNPYSQTEKSYTNKVGSGGLSLPLVLFPAVGVSLGSKADDQDDTRWHPGWIKVESRWKPYRIPGLAIYDAWGHEILVNYHANGRLMVLSAGRDGVLRWNPGRNMVIDTGAKDIQAKGDDKDGREDNIGTEKVEDD